MRPKVRIYTQEQVIESTVSTMFSYHVVVSPVFLLLIKVVCQELVLVQVGDGGQGRVVLGAELLDLAERHRRTVVHEAGVAQQAPAGLTFPGKQTEREKNPL